MPPSLFRALIASIAVVVILSGSRADAQDYDQPLQASPAVAEMLKALRERGILSEEAYQDAYRKEAKYEAEQREKDALPGWVKGWTFGGDMRLRWDREDFGGELEPGRVYVLGDDNINTDRPVGGTGNGTGLRDRFLMRLRVGAEKQLNEDFAIGFRIATAQATGYGANIGIDGQQATYSRVIGANPRSENVTMGDYFSGKAIWIDRAYFRYSPSFAPTLRLTAGKIANPFTSGQNLAESLMWDPEINPEGAAAQYRFDLAPETLWFDGSAGYFQIAEVGAVTLDVPPAASVTIAPNYDEKDPSMWGVQGGLTGRPLEWLTANARVAYYDLRDLNTDFMAYANDLGNGGDVVSTNPLLVLLTPSNPLFNSGASRGHLKEVVLDGYVNLVPWGERFRIKPFFMWSEVLTADTENNAYGVGLELGDADFLKLTGMYAVVDRNGTVAMFTDSDILGGFTNVKGWYVSLERRITNFMRLRSQFSKSKIAEEACLIAGDGVPEQCDTFFALFPERLAEYRKTQRDRTRWQVDLQVDF